ncbi:MAG: ferredoxin [Lentisphaeraceae bacterium]|nr:ferredoxin [Lentisphaeraceae bacterium]
MRNLEAHPQNIDGKLYCTEEGFDNGCIGCGICYGQLPQVFAEDDEAYAYVFKIPNDDELELVKEVIQDCPVGSIILED